MRDVVWSRWWITNCPDLPAPRRAVLLAIFDVSSGSSMEPAVSYGLA